MTSARLIYRDDVPCSRLLSELRRMKDGGVPWTRAWACSAGADRGKHFMPSAADPGTELPASRNYIEPMSRFYYRVFRECYLDLGTPWGATTDTADDPVDYSGIVAARRAA